MQKAAFKGGNCNLSKYVDYNPNITTLNKVSIVHFLQLQLISTCNTLPICAA